jgi:molecular chaperone DnaK (HSP70)
MKVFIGERPKTDDNHLIGVMKVRGISNEKRGIPSIVINISVTEAGILQISCKEVLDEASYFNDLSDFKERLLRERQLQTIIQLPDVDLTQLEDVISHLVASDPETKKKDEREMHRIMEKIEFETISRQYQSTLDNSRFLDRLSHGTKNFKYIIIDLLLH